MNGELSERVTSVILAGGQGKRLFPLTRDRCKPAVAFGGHYRLIDIPISNSLNSRIGNLFVISQYFASDLQQHILSTYHPEFHGLSHFEMLCPEERFQEKEWFKGTADAVRQNLAHLMKTSADYFLILSGDQLYHMDLLQIVRFAVEKKADFLVASIKVGRDEATRMGILKVNSHLRIVDFYEKPEHPEQIPHLEVGPLQFLVSMGIYVFKRDVLKRVLEEESGNDFGSDIIPSQIKKLYATTYIYDGYWEDIGTISSYYKANLSLTLKNNPLNMYDENRPIYACPLNLPSPIIKKTLIQDSIISQGSIIESKEIIHSVIGIRAHIKKDTVIRDSIILGNHFYVPPMHQQHLPREFSIGERCWIEKAIIDEQVCIGNDVRLINQNQLQTYDGDGIYIREGIIIVTSGTQVPSGFVL
jgi:glucose-1-phosphate adenylyltransferase